MSDQLHEMLRCTLLKIWDEEELHDSFVESFFSKFGTIIKLLILFAQFSEGKWRREDLILFFHLYVHKNHRSEKQILRAWIQRFVLPELNKKLILLRLEKKLTLLFAKKNVYVGLNFYVSCYIFYLMTCKSTQLLHLSIALNIILPYVNDFSSKTTHSSIKL